MTYLLHFLAGPVPPPVSVNPPQTVLMAVLILGSSIVGGLLVALKTVWASYRESESKRQAETVAFTSKTEDMLRVQIATTSDATRRIAESEKTVEAAMTIIHQIQGRQPSGEQLAEIVVLLRDLRDRR